VQVQGIIRETPGVTKISFLAHSLGGLITRYAIGQLYRPPQQPNVLERESENPATPEDGSGVQSTNSGRVNPENAHEATSTSYGTMAGLIAANFITVATPHLGSRGSRQVFPLY
jgi:esterase/lipase superfamily enzyme